jgi:hypothetical protein
MSKSVLEADEPKVYDKVNITIQFRDKVLSGIPQNGDMLEYFLRTKFATDAEKEDFTARMKAGTLTQEEQDELKNTNCQQFERDADGNLCIWHGNLKAMLREVFTTLGFTQWPCIKTKKGGREFSAGGKQVMQHGVFVDPARILFHAPMKNVIDPSIMQFNPYQKADGTLTKPVHIEDQAGKRTALKAQEYLEQPFLSFTCKWLAKRTFDVKDLRQAFLVCQDDGLGASRSQGYGTFDVIKWDVIWDHSGECKPVPEDEEDAPKTKSKKEARVETPKP